MNREQIDARIFNHIKHEYSPEYKLVNLRTRWISQREGKKFFAVRYFLTSGKFIGGIRFDTVSVQDKEINILDYDDPT